MKLMRLLSLLAAAAACAACHREAVVPLTGFIPDSVPLVLNRDNGSFAYKNPAKPQSGFNSVFVHSVKIMDDGGDPAEAGNLAAQFRGDIIAAVGLPSAAAPGPGVLEIRAAITGLQVNDPVFNVAPQTQVRKRGYGYVAAEVYAIDGRDGGAVAGYADTQDTQRFSLEKFTPWGSAQAGLKTMADAFGALLKSQ